MDKNQYGKHLKKRYISNNSIIGETTTSFFIYHRIHSKYRPLWHYYFENNDAVIYVIDSSDHERFDEAKEELWDLIKDDRLRDSALLVLANKQVIRIFAILNSN